MKELSPEQVARMRPESRERYEKRLKAVKRNRKILGIFCGVFAGGLLLLILSLTILFNVTSINVAKTGAFYTKSEIISASGIDIGDNMLRTDFEKASERIEKNLPYVLDAVITKKLSGEVTITIKDTTAAILIESNQGYALADIHGKVLEIIKEIPKDSKFMVIKTNSKLEAITGESFAFTDDAEKKLYDELVEALEKADMFKNITKVDITDRTAIKVEYQNRLRLLLGTAEDLEIKLRGAAETIKAEDSKDPTTVAEINLTIPKKVFVNSIDSLVEEEETTEETKDIAASTDEYSDTSKENSEPSDEENSEDTETHSSSEDDEDTTENTTKTDEE